jgi:broad specificity phosphatase PhoE
MMTIVVVRHAEVSNPNHVVYADLPGFDLSATGVRQVHDLGKHLASAPVGIVVSSPLARARHTATAIARHHDGVGVTIDPRLTETRMYPGWTGLKWDDIERRFPDQLAGYLKDATSLDDVSESVDDVLGRVRSCVDDAIAHGHQTIVVVGHQDPSQILRLGLVGRPLSELRVDPPEHASATTITPVGDGTFVEDSVWSPQDIEL